MKTAKRNSHFHKHNVSISKGTRKTEYKRQIYIRRYAYKDEYTYKDYICINLPGYFFPRKKEFSDFG